MYYPCKNRALLAINGVVTSTNDLINGVIGTISPLQVEL